MSTDWQNSWKFNNQLLEVCSSLLWHGTACTYAYVLQSSLIACSVTCLGTFLQLLADARILDIFPHLPQHPSFSFSISQLKNKQQQKKPSHSLLPVWVLILYVSSAIGNWNDSFLLYYHITQPSDSWNWAELGMSRMGIEVSTVDTGTQFKCKNDWRIVIRDPKLNKTVPAF